MQLNGFRACEGDTGDIRPLFFLCYFLAQFEIKLFDVSWCRLLLKSERSKFRSGVHVQICTSSFLSCLLIYWMWRQSGIPMNNNLTGVVYLWGSEREKNYTHIRGLPHVRRFETERTVNVKLKKRIYVPYTRFLWAGGGHIHSRLKTFLHISFR
jgi:hypothetical protein